MSGASVSSFASSAEGSSVRSQSRQNGPSFEDGEIFDDSQTLQLGVFGVLYTVSKERELTSVGFAFFRMFLDFLQLWLLVVNPSYGWAIDANNRAWEVVSFIQLNAFLSARGYSFFLALLYVFVGLLAINMALSIWVANSFSNNRFEYVWPIQFLRWFGLIFYQVLDIATLTLLLVTLDCNYFNVPAAAQFHNQEFPSIMCWSMPHIVHVAVSGVSIVVFVTMATAQVVSEMELNPLTRNYMAIAHTRVEGYGFAIKVIVTIASVTIATSVQWLAVVYFFFFAILFYLAVRWVPFVYSTLNYVRCASYGTVLYCSVLLLVLAFGPSGSRGARSDFRERMTWAMWAGMAPAAAAGALACHLRLRHFNVHVLSRFKHAESGMSAKAVYRFNDAREVEIAARCCRRWMDDGGGSGSGRVGGGSGSGGEGALDPDAVELSEAIIKSGMMQLPQDPQMIILYSSFLIDVQGSYQSGYTQLQTAKKQAPGVLERFAIFSREQAHTQKASGAGNGGADSAVDLVSYVEFQRNHRLVVRAHREALLAMRSFWGLLLRHHVGFNHLSKALHRIEVSVKGAERAYRGVLARHGSSPRLVRLYGRFLETVKFDPWAASKWYSEADRLEEEAELTREALQLGGMENLLPQANGANQGLSDMDGVAFICINAKGVIQVASPEAHAMLGYQRNELKGKDVGIIMPPPFGERHSAYVRNYIQTGHASLLDRTTDMVVITRNRQVLRVKLRVNKVSGLNEDSVFLGVLEAVQPNPDEARAWVLGNGTLVAADERFCDWLGYESADLPGAPLEALVVEKDSVREVIKGFSRTQHAAYAGVHRYLPRPPSNANANDAAASDRPDRAVTALNPNASGAGNAGGGAYSKAISGMLDVKLSWLRRMSHGGNDAASATGAGLSAAVAPNAPVLLPRLAWRHMYTEPLGFDTRLQPGAFGSVKVHCVILRRCSPPTNSGATPGELLASGAVPLAHGPAGRGGSIAAASAASGAAGRRSYERPQAAVAPPSPRCRIDYDDMLLVADTKGRLLHVTAALADALGRSVEAVQAGGLSMLIPEPVSVLHGPWLQELANPQSGSLSPLSSAPPYSCRRGVAVCLAAHNHQGEPDVRPFRLQVRQRMADGGGSKVHVVSLKPLNMEQARAERRLSLTVDLAGTILAADEATPSELFGADPRVLPGTSVAQLIDLFHSAAAPSEPAAHDRSTLHLGPAPGAVGGADGPEAALARRRLTRALLELARRSSEGPGCSWRVGVHVPPSEAAQRQLEQLAALLGPEDADLAAKFQTAKTVPAVMTLRLVEAPAALTAAAVGGRQPGAAATGGQLQHSHGRRYGDQAGGVWAPAKETGAWGGALGRRAGAGPVAEATEAGAEGQDAAAPPLLDAEDEATLQELTAAIESPLLPRPPSHTAAPAAATPVVLAAEPAAAAARAANGTPQNALPGRQLQGVASVSPPPSAPAPLQPPRVTLAEPDDAPGAHTATPLTRSAAQLPLSQLSLPPSPTQRPGERISRMLGHASGEALDARADSRSQPSRAGGGMRGLYDKPMSLRLPPEEAAAVAKAAVAALEDSSLSDSILEEMEAGEDAAAGRVGGHATATPGLVLELELWRADLLSGILEVDDRGRVLRADANSPLARADLVLGAVAGSLLGSPISTSLPLPPGGVTALLEPSPGDSSAVRGALKKRNSRQGKAGAPVIMAARHQSDCCRLALTVQAVQRAGPSGSAFLLVRPFDPVPAQAGFERWLYEGDPSGLMTTPPAAGSGSGTASGSGNSGTGHGGVGGKDLRVATLALGSGRPGSFLAGGADGAGGGENGGRRRSVSLSRDAAPEHLRAPATVVTSGGGAVSGDGKGGSGKAYGTVWTATAAGITSASLTGYAANAAAAKAALLSPRIASVSGQEDVRAGSLGGRPAAGNVRSAPHRLSFTSALPQTSNITDEEADGGSGGDESPGRRKSDSTVQDTAYEAPQHQLVSVVDSQASNDEMAGPEAAAVAAAAVEAAGLLVRATASPRQSAELTRKPAEPALRPTSRLNTKKHNMVHSWVLSGDSPHRAAAARAPEARASPLPNSVKDDGGDGDGSDGGSERSSPAGSEAPSGADGASSAGGSSSEGGSSSDSKAKPSGGSDSGLSSVGDEQDMESEAGAHVANYSVGKRFKKLHKILTSPLAQQPARKLRWHAVGTVLAILVAHTITFALLLTQLVQQETAVQDLNSAAMACSRVHEIVTHGRVLEALYAGNTYVEGLPQFGQPVGAALNETYDALSPLLTSLQELHRGVYAGFHNRRRIPTSFGLRGIWDDPALNVTLFYDANDPADPSRILPFVEPPAPRSVALGLWDAGNLFLAQALDLHNRGPAVVAQGANFTTWSTWRFVESNGPSVLFPAYEATLDALVQLTVARSRDIYVLQLIVLCLEGGLLCFMACCYMWFTGSKFSLWRHKLYGVFIQIPIGVIRGLAHMSLKLEENDEDDEDEHMHLHHILAAEHGGGIHHFHAADEEPGDNGGAGGGGGGSGLTDGAVRAAAAGHGNHGHEHSNHGHGDSMGRKASGHKRRTSTLMFAVDGAPGDEERGGAGPGAGPGAAPGGEGGRGGGLLGLGGALGAIAFWRARSKVSPQGPGKEGHGHKHKRQLVPSQRLAYSLLAPFILWGVAVVAVNLWGYMDLEAMSAPIAALNVVNVVLIRIYRILYYVLEVAAATSVDARAFFKSGLRSELGDLKLEYSAMLYGNQAVPAEAAELPHFRLEKTGVVFGGFEGPYRLLYDSGDCLCADPADCQPPNSTLYEMTHRGLNVLMMSQFKFVEALVVQPPETSGMNSTEFRAVWATGRTDMAGGMTRMSSLFLDEVQNAYNKVVVQQIVMFCVAWVWGLAFLALQLRPLLRRTHREMRRIAELLSQLPAEVDCEGLVMGVILGEHGAPPLPPGLAGKKGPLGPFGGGGGGLFGGGGNGAGGAGPGGGPFSSLAGFSGLAKTGPGAGRPHEDAPPALTRATTMAAARRSSFEAAGLAGKSRASLSASGYVKAGEMAAGKEVLG